MPKPEEHHLGHADISAVLECVCRAYGLPIDRTSAGERNADCELAASWLEAIHTFKLDPFVSPIVSASVVEAGEDM